MKNIFLIFLFLIFQSQSSFGEWKKVGQNSQGKVYLDFERIRKNQSYVYFWEMRDILIPNKMGVKSGITYKQGDCNLFRYKILTDTFYNNFEGKGKVLHSSNTPDKEWTYPRPGTGNEQVLNIICRK